MTYLCGRTPKKSCMDFLERRISHTTNDITSMHYVGT